MALLSSLPNELMVYILSYLQTFEVERLARTLNKRITHLCAPFLRVRVSAARNARRAISVFGRPYHLVFDELEALHALAKLEEVHGAFNVPDSRALLNLNYLDMCGDLHWLGPLDDRTAAETAGWSKAELDAPIALGTEMDAWLERAIQLDLQVPTAFVRLMTEPGMRRRMPFMVAEPSLTPLVRVCSQNLCLDGHILEIFAGSFDTDEWWYLFLKPGGGECVISSEWDLHDNETPDKDEAEGDMEDEHRIVASEPQRPETEWEPEYRTTNGSPIRDNNGGDMSAKQDGIAHEDIHHEGGVKAVSRLSVRRDPTTPRTITLTEDMVAGIKLRTTSFEEYMAQVHFIGWAWTAVQFGIDDPLPATLEDFIVNVFTEKGREQFMI
jgi:hypothetical protein